MRRSYFRTLRAQRTWIPTAGTGGYRGCCLKGETKSCRVELKKWYDHGGQVIPLELVRLDSVGEQRLFRNSGAPDLFGTFQQFDERLFDEVRSHYQRQPWRSWPSVKESLHPRENRYRKSANLVP